MSNGAGHNVNKNTIIWQVFFLPEEDFKISPYIMLIVREKKWNAMIDRSQRLCTSIPIISFEDHSYTSITISNVICPCRSPALTNNGLNIHTCNIFKILDLLQIRFKYSNRKSTLRPIAYPMYYSLQTVHTLFRIMFILAYTDHLYTWTMNVFLLTSCRCKQVEIHWKPIQREIVVLWSYVPWWRLYSYMYITDSVVFLL